MNEKSTATFGDWAKLVPAYRYWLRGNVAPQLITAWLLLYCPTTDKICQRQKKLLDWRPKVQFPNALLFPYPGNQWKWTFRWTEHYLCQVSNEWNTLLENRESRRNLSNNGPKKHRASRQRTVSEIETQRTSSRANVSKHRQTLKR